MKTANPCRKNYRPEIDPYLCWIDSSNASAEFSALVLHFTVGVLNLVL